MKESEEMRLKSTINESTLSTADAVPLPRWGRQRNENTDIPISSKRIQDMWKNNNGGQSLPPWGNAVKLRGIHRVSCFFSLST